MQVRMENPARGYSEGTALPKLPKSGGTVPKTSLVQTPAIARTPRSRSMTSRHELTRVTGEGQGMGDVSERPEVRHWKCRVMSQPPRVRIPLSHLKSNFSYGLHHGNVGPFRWRLKTIFRFD